jgi:hypothetical protein
LFGEGSPKEKAFEVLDVNNDGEVRLLLVRFMK